MARKISKPTGPFRAISTVFEKGRERPIEITLFPQYVEVRAVGIPQRYHVTYGSILRLGAEAQVQHRIRRGAIHGPG
jgi:hypothetical protein